MSTLRRHDLLFLFEVLYFMFIVVISYHECFKLTSQVVNNLCSTPFLLLSDTCSNVHAMHSLVSLPYVVTLDLATPYT